MELTQQEIKYFIETVKNKSDYDFGEYSIKSFTRRVEKLLTDYKTDVYDLCDRLNNPAFLEQIVKDITVNTTELFRDPEIWKIIWSKIIPKYASVPSINIWHAGSSSGQEVFSMIIFLIEAGLIKKSKIFATDLNSDVLKTAKSGKYKYREIDEYINNYEGAFEGIEMPPMKNYIDISRTKSLIRIKPQVVNKAVFKKHDLISCENPFPQKYHIIFCRNVLIYFNHELQNKIFEFFHRNMHRGGTLIIGRHEGILGEIGSKFEKMGTIYIKK